jgi:hypothetical protein
MYVKTTAKCLERVPVPRFACDAAERTQSKCTSRKPKLASLKHIVTQALLRRPLHILKLPPIEAVNALSEQVSASAAVRKSEEDSEDDL